MRGCVRCGSVDGLAGHEAHADPFDCIRVLHVRLAEGMRLVGEFRVLHVRLAEGMRLVGESIGVYEGLVCERDAARAEEREACLQIVEAYDRGPSLIPAVQMVSATAAEIAAAIRARGKP